MTTNDTIVTVDRLWNDGSVTIGWGTDIATGDTITFAGDRRPMDDIATVLASGELVDVSVPGWAIIARRARPATI